jgi:protein-L-isoaspartate(D-aspartate) O-methyltransferase
MKMLKPLGRLFVIVGRPPVMEARVITMYPGGQWTEQDQFETSLAPLLNAERSEPFVL